MLHTVRMPIYDPRGEMKNFSVNEDGTVNAILSPAVQADENGDIVNGVVTETEFYKTGETLWIKMAIKFRR